jgi:hypothetical protein
MFAHVTNFTFQPCTVTRTSGPGLTRSLHPFKSYVTGNQTANCIPKAAYRRLRHQHVATVIDHRVYQPYYNAQHALQNYLSAATPYLYSYIHYSDMWIEHHHEHPLTLWERLYGRSSRVA